MSAMKILPPSIEPAGRHPLDADRDRWLIEHALPVATLAIALIVIIDLALQVRP